MKPEFQETSVERALSALWVFSFRIPGPSAQAKIGRIVFTARLKPGPFKAAENILDNCAYVSLHRNNILQHPNPINRDADNIPMRKGELRRWNNPRAGHQKRTMRKAQFTEQITK